MTEINRSILIVKPKQPFLDWIHTLKDSSDVTLAELQEDCTAYLIPELMDKEDQLILVEKHFQDMFEVELESWSRDISLWPNELSLDLFKEWLSLEFHSIVMDLSEDDIELLDWE